MSSHCATHAGEHLLPFPRFELKYRSLNCSMVCMYHTSSSLAFAGLFVIGQNSFGGKDTFNGVLTILKSKRKSQSYLKLKSKQEHDSHKSYELKTRLCCD
jgi:hypothetical protein